MEEILKVEGLTKSFKQPKKFFKQQGEAVKIAVNNLSFTVDRGEIFGLLGPNGAGKTTTLRMLATLIKPDSGNAFICGKSIVSDESAVRRKIGFLTGELKLDETFTPAYLFEFFSDLYGIDKSVCKERMSRLFRKFGINEFATQKLGNLSTGMKQKTALVVSIAHDPEFIIFDEPTNGLDVLTAKVVTDFLQELRAEGKTIILSTHIFSLVEKLCDRVGVLINGRLVALDSLQNLTKEKNLEETFFELYEKTTGERV
ncbi:MAG: ABC transporter ATP-binding protein [Clostridia bacterium]|nr:ABC transporter ATP-binding protein [Clostridia bacterium]